MKPAGTGAPVAVTVVVDVQVPPNNPTPQVMLVDVGVTVITVSGSSEDDPCAIVAVGRVVDGVELIGS